MSDLEKMVQGLHWLSTGGREAARDLKEALAEREDIVLEEAIAWLDDIEAGNEI